MFILTLLGSPPPGKKILLIISFVEFFKEKGTKFCVDSFFLKIYISTYQKTLEVKFINVVSLALIVQFSPKWQKGKDKKNLTKKGWECTGGKVEGIRKYDKEWRLIKGDEEIMMMMIMMIIIILFQVQKNTTSVRPNKNNK